MGIFRRMSHMTLLDGTLWFGLSVERFDTSAKAAESGYPPYDIELAPKDDRGPEVLRITLAVAGFGRDELNVLIEDGELMICGTKRDEARRTIFTAASPRASSNGPSPWPVASKSARPSCTRAFSPSSSNGHIRRDA